VAARHTHGTSLTATESVAASLAVARAMAAGTRAVLEAVAKAEAQELSAEAEEL
jgi:hypothetical protein